MEERERDRARGSLQDRVRDEIEVIFTHTTFPKLLSIDRRCKVQAPCVVRHRILPVDETFRRLSYSRSYNNRRRENLKLKFFTSEMFAHTHLAELIEHQEFCRPDYCKL